jgi:hypothetical protein
LKKLPKIGDLLYCSYKDSCYGYSIVVKITTNEDKVFKGLFDQPAEIVVAWPLGGFQPGQRLYKDRYYVVFSTHSYVAEHTKIIASLDKT